MSSKTIGLRVSEETKVRLEKLGEARDRTPHYLMKQAVERFLETEEAIEAERELVQKRWEKFELTGETLPHDQIKTWAQSLTNDNS
ncbi:MAG: hypothetical protein MI743_14730 [Sneathiellales bacterium]|nr:hypothetical protein [Sneathiellales bacterium]